MNNAWLHDPFEWAPIRKLGGGWIAFKSAPSAPPAPDYAGAASATAAGNKENTIAAQQGSMVNQFTPYGNITYSQDGNWNGSNNPKYNANISLDPTAQKTLDSQLALSNNMGDLANSAAGRADQAYSQPFDTSSVKDIYDKAYGAQTARLDPQWQANSEAQDNKLANQGIMVGSHAYDDSMRTFNQAKNDAYTQAQQSAISNMPQTYQLATATREQPLNELNAIRTGAQIQNPQFSAQPQQQYTPGPDMLGAAGLQNQYNMGLYNSQVGSNNSMMTGLLTAGASAAAIY